MQSEEYGGGQLSATRMPTDPNAGEKRPRSDDDSTQELRLSPREGDARMDTTMTSASSHVNQSGNPMNGMSTGPPVQMGTNANHDALYIGDLQWVR